MLMLDGNLMINKKLLGPQSLESVVKYFRSTGCKIRPTTAADELYL